MRQHYANSSAQSDLISAERIARTMNDSETMQPLSAELRHILVVSFALIDAIAFLGNLSILLYIICKRKYRSFVSHHFIAHLTLANLLTCSYLVPIFIQNLDSDSSLMGDNVNGYSFLCRLHAFILCMLWTVTHFMVTCIAGVHLLTFARIHYEQLFGLSPSIICALSWVIGAALGLPCITNTDLVDYNSLLYHCMWQDRKIGYHFLAYMVLLGVILPLALTYYAYGRILTIFYHSPVVFEALGIFRARYLIFAFLLNPLSQVPFYVMNLIDASSIANASLVLPLVAFLAYAMCFLHFVLYGVSLFIMKEDDMTLITHNKAAQKHNYLPPGIQAPGPDV